MIRKSSLFITTFLFISMLSFSQSIKENVQKLSGDPKTSENAAKGDVYIVGHTKIADDSLKLHTQSNQARAKKTSRKKKHCSKSTN